MSAPAVLPSVEDIRDSEPATLESACGWITALAHRVLDLEARLAREVRTRRVVVEDGDGFERVELGAGANSGHVKVHGRDIGSGPRSVELSADEDSAGVGFAGLYLHGWNETLGRFETSDEPGHHADATIDVSLHCVTEGDHPGEVEQASLEPHALRLNGISLVPPDCDSGRRR